MASKTSLVRTLRTRLFNHKEAPFFTKDRLRRPLTTIGDFTYGLPNIMEYGEGSALEIGKYCSIAENVLILLGGEHRTDWITTYPFPILAEGWQDAAAIQGHPRSKGNVVIGNDVWIGTGATILSGVKIGDGAVIGAHAVVAKDVDSYAIAVGNPVKIVRKRFSESQVSALLRIRWWDWPTDKIKQRVQLLCSDRIDEFIAAADPLQSAMPDQMGDGT
jgi:acetyltransferase-like isoleucine patch superfamily enzyme